MCAFPPVADDLTTQYAGSYLVAVQNPISFYLDLVDRAAFLKAESRQPVGQFDTPFTPLFAPSLLGVPLLALTPTSSIAWDIIAGLTLATSFVCWVAVAMFYMKRVYAYREQLGIKIDPPDRRLAVVILMGVGLAFAYAFWQVFSPSA